MLTKDQIKALEKVLNEQVPNGYKDFDEFADIVLSVIGPGDGEEWSISPHHTGLGQVGQEIKLPHVNAVVIWDTWSWTVAG